MRNLSQEDKRKAKADYQSLVKSGMLHELYPQLCGNWSCDKSDWYDEFLGTPRKRYVIPVCNEHGRFQSVNGRWLSIADDLNEHLTFTNSHDAILTNGQCDECVTDEQIKLEL